MIGMGFSDKPVAYGYSVHDHADMHEALLAHLGVERCHMLAHDLGDSVGQELLARNVFGEHVVRRGELSSRSPGSTAACSTRRTRRGPCRS